MNEAFHLVSANFGLWLSGCLFSSSSLIGHKKKNEGLSGRAWGPSGSLMLLWFAACPGLNWPLLFLLLPDYYQSSNTDTTPCHMKWQRLTDSQQSWSIPPCTAEQQICNMQCTAVQQIYDMKYADSNKKEKIDDNPTSQLGYFWK